MEAHDDPRFLKGIEEFNQGLFFECHETLEEIWLEEHGEDRKFYQALIQISAGYFKLEQGVPAGAIKLWRMGLEKLGPYRPVYRGVNLDSLNDAVNDHLRRLEANPETAAESLDPPTILFIC
jgi:predicted metal-dependent hydrolase